MIGTQQDHLDRVLVIPPTARDAKATADILLSARLTPIICLTVPDLVKELQLGGAVLLLTEDCLAKEGVPELIRLIHEQPAWSDIPVIVLMRGATDSPAVTEVLKRLRNVTLLDRPVATRVLVSAVEVAIRSRRRQYEIRELIESEKAARQEAEGAARSKDEFLAVVSHELRTPLNGILGWSQILKRKTPSGEMLREGLDAIERSAKSQARLIEDMLDMSRITSGKLRLDLEEVWPATIVDAAVETIKPDAAARGVTIEHAIDATAGPVHGDAERLQQVVWNLLSNAVKFTPAPGTVRILLSANKNMVEIRVSDSGIGIDQDFLPHVFDQFRQADSSSKRAFGGLGLGLSIVKQLVELHGGSVSAQSAGKDLGATFTVSLPSLQRIRTDFPDPTSGHSNGSNSYYKHDFSGLRIMIVDDDGAAVEVVRIILEDCKAVVLAAHSGPQALKLLETANPDILVSDLGMPQMDGFELIREVRRQGRQMPAIAVTAFARAEDKTRAIDAGFDRHMAKPVEPGQLLSIIDSLVHSI